MAGYLSEDTTNFSGISTYGGGIRTSRISSTGSTLVNELWASSISAAAFTGGAVSNFSSSVVSASRVTSNVSILGNAIWASTISMGGFNFPASISVSSFNVVAQVVQGSASTFTVCATVTSVQKGDILLVSPFGGAGVSSLSSGLVAHAHCTQAGQFEFRYSNVSTLAQNQSAQTFNLCMIRL